jgi:hypothetical protein
MPDLNEKGEGRLSETAAPLFYLDFSLGCSYTCPL